MSPRWRSALAVLVVLAGCGGGGDEATAPAPPQAVGGASSPTGTKDRPRVAPAPRPPAGETWGAKVTKRVALRAAPSRDSRRLAIARRRTEFGSVRILAVVRQRGRWLGVVSEKLGNGRIGWVRYDRVKLLRELWSIEVDLSKRRATLRRRGKAFRSFPVAVGAPGTDTPPGLYGITDRLTTGGPGSPYGCCVLALSGRQPNVPQDWPGGDRLAIHGTSAPESIGLAASSGCLRATEESMRMLIGRVPLGAQVRIRR